MTTNDTLLREGIAAVKLGQRERARSILMQVVEADERNEQGWLWLSGVVDDPADQRVCLENVLDINPRNEQAQKGVAWLDAHHPAKPQLKEAVVASPAPTAAPQPAAPPEPSAEDISIPAGPLPVIENPCPFCGSPTRLDQRRCVQCKHSLMVRDAPSQRRSAATGTLAGLWFMGGALSLVATVLLVALLYGEPDLLLQQLGQLQTAALLNNGFVIIGSLLLWSLLAIGTAVGLRRRQRWAFFAHIALSILTTILSVQFILSQRATLTTVATRNQLPDSLVSQASTVAFAILAALVFLTIVLTMFSYGDFFSSMVRVLTVVPERDDEDHYNMGIAYRNRDMWYMAVKEWEGAVQRRPSDAEYRRALGLAYAQIRQFGRAVRELREAVRLRSTDQGIKDDLALIEGMALKEMGGNT